MNKYEQFVNEENQNIYDIFDVLTNITLQKMKKSANDDVIKDLNKFKDWIFGFIEMKKNNRKKFDNLSENENVFDYVMNKFKIIFDNTTDNELKKYINNTIEEIINKFKSSNVSPVDFKKINEHYSIISNL